MTTGDQQAESGGARPTQADRAKREIRAYLIVSAYLYVCFGALMLYKAAILDGAGISFSHFGLAIVKALILGKFILLGEAMKLGEKETPGRLVVDILQKSVLFMLLLLVLSIIEEAVVGLLHHHPIRDVLNTFNGGSLAQSAAMSLIMLLILVPYFAFGAISRSLGAGKLTQILFARRPPTA